VALSAWTAIGGTGTPDEADVSELAFNNDGSVSIKPSISSASAKIRFNVIATRDVSVAVTPFDNDFKSPLEMSAIVLDNGPRARVIATLKRMPLPFSSSGAATTTLAVIDSDRPQKAPDDPSLYFRNTVQLSENGRDIPDLNFWQAAYFVEVQLVKSGPGGDPRLRAVTIFHDDP
jgi:hypothetical protein